MAEFSIRFQKVAKNAKFDAPVPVTVHYEANDSEQIKFKNPLSDKNLSEIRWYLEQYTRWPSDIDHERARRVEGDLPKWGRALFDAVFGKSSEAMRLFGRFDDDHAAGRVLAIETTEPRILRLPWELLYDEGGYLFSKNPPVSVLRRMRQTRRTIIKDFTLPVRILMVACRPDGAGFIDPRSIASPLLDALEGIPKQVEVEFLRPPTLTALDQRLRDPGRPDVHIVHFDGHGVYERSVGLGFLLFEDENHGRHNVDAEQLGALLNESGIPLMVLNACQSAQPDERNPFASVAARLIESGVGGVVAMNYSVLVETAKRFTKEFYGGLARGQSASAAMDSARRGLFSDTKRITFTRPNQEAAETLHLQDWFLPALYQQAEELAPFSPRPLAPSPPAKPGERGKGARAAFPPPPLHGFHGRARELLELERAFARRRVVVLHGFGGQGKTALAAQAAQWFRRTRLFERAAFISFERGAGLEQALAEFGNALVSDKFTIHEGDPVQAIADALASVPTLLVWDNFESALPSGNAPLEAQELQALLAAGAQWAAQGGSRLLVTTRNPEIPHEAYTPGTNCLRKELEGLDATDALELAASILEAHGLARPPRLPLEELLRFLKGHPLSLQLALPQLRDYRAEQLVEEYQQILPSIQSGKGEERNESLAVSLRFSLDRLGAEATALLIRLAVFEGGALEPALLAVTEIPEQTWNALKPQLTSTALIRVEEIPGVEQPFIHFHPTLAPYLRALNPPPAAGSGQQPDGNTAPLGEGRQGAYARYWQVYYRLANQLYRDDRQHPLQARAILLRELPNLKRALKLALAAGALKEAVDFADSINWFLDVFGRWRERDELAAEVERAVSSNQSSVNSGGGITQAEFLMESGRGERLLQQGRGGAAQQIFRALLQRLEGEAAYDTRYDQTLVLGYLGRCLGAQGHPAQAAECYRRALALAQGLEQTENVKRQISAYHTDLADTFGDLGQYDEARKEYESALEVDRELGDERGQGVVLGQLGTLAMRQGDLNEARKRYTDALGLFQRLGEDQSEAVLWHQLGVVAAEQAQRVGAQHAAPLWDEAEHFYNQARIIRERIQDLPNLAATCNQLAILAENTDRPQEAERWYLRAIELKEKHSTPKDLSSSLSNLAGLYLVQNRLDEAETCARRALEIKETLDLSAQPWTTYAILAQLAEKRGRAGEARALRRKEQESFAAFAGSDQHIKQYEPLIAAIVNAASGDEKAKAYLEDMYPKMQAGGEEWARGSEAIRRLVAGERNFDVLTEGLARTQALIIRRILQALGGGSPSPRPSPAGGGGQPPSPAAGESQPASPAGGGSQPASPAGRGAGGEGGLTLPQLLDLVERAAAGDPQLGRQLFGLFQQMSSAGDPVTASLGKTLALVLLGEPNPNLDGLPGEIASALRGLLGRLQHG